MRMTASSTSLSVLGRAQTRESRLGRLFFGLTRATFRHVLTGSYHNYFRIFDVDSLSDVVLQADKSAFKAKKIGGPLPGNKLGAKNGTRGLRDAMQMETLDFNKKILHASWHPRENTIAVRFISSFQRGRTLDIHLYSSDRCNEQPVFIQRRIAFVVVPVKLVVWLRRRLFHFSVLQYILRSFSFTFLTLSTLFVAISHRPPSSDRSDSSSRFLASYLNVTHMTPLDLRPCQFLGSRSLHFTYFTSHHTLSSPLHTHARSHPLLPVQSPSVDQIRR